MEKFQEERLGRSRKEGESEEVIEKS